MTALIEDVIEREKISFGIVIEWYDYNVQIHEEKKDEYEDFNAGIQTRFHFDRKSSKVERQAIHRIIDDIIEFIENDEIEDGA